MGLASIGTNLSLTALNKFLLPDLNKIWRTLGTQSKLRHKPFGISKKIRFFYFIFFFLSDSFKSIKNDKNLGLCDYSKIGFTNFAII